MTRVGNWEKIRRNCQRTIIEREGHIGKEGDKVDEHIVDDRDQSTREKQVIEVDDQDNQASENEDVEVENIINDEEQ
ncbi:unnamed protein product [Linum trigynum]|uniref:Uncharacterized protein n=1 Tax=Linum trigynum TaxID=586398 RepID=A0AAV2CF05_9ROSI